MSPSDAANSPAVRGMVLAGFGLWIAGSIISSESLRDLAMVFVVIGAVAYFILARRKSDEED